MAQTQQAQYFKYLSILNIQGTDCGDAEVGSDKAAQGAWSRNISALEIIKAHRLLMEFSKFLNLCLPLSPEKAVEPSDLSGLGLN